MPKLTVDAGNKNTPDLHSCTLMSAVLEGKTAEPKILIVNDTSQISKIVPLPVNASEAFYIGFKSACDWLASQDLKVLRSVSTDSKEK